MGFFDFNLIKSFTLKLKSIFNFKFERHESKSQIVAKTVNQYNFPIIDSPLARELIENLPKSRKDNVAKIISNAQKSTETKTNNTIKPPETEWLGPFLDSCKDIHAKDLQDIWSKILEGKINGTQNSSVRTMSVLKNMSSVEANLFKQFLKYKIGDFVYYEEGKMPEEFPIYSKISLLSEIGLIQIRGVSTIIERSQNVLPKEMFNYPQLFVPNRGYLGIYCGYLLFFDFPPDKKIVTIPSIVLSKAGIEISQFVKYQINDEYLSCLSRFLKSKNLQLKKIKVSKTPKDIEKFINVKNRYKSVAVFAVSTGDD